MVPDQNETETRQWSRRLPRRAGEVLFIDARKLGYKMTTLTTELSQQFHESAKLEIAIRKNMKALGFELPAVAGKE